MKRESRAREGVILAVGLGSALSLILGAWFGMRVNPAAGEILAGRLAGEIIAAARTEWARWCASEEIPVARASQRMRVSVAARPSEGACEEVLAREDRTRPSPLGFFLQAAESLEFEGNLALALARLEEGLQRNPEGALRPEAYLRAMQFARRTAEVEKLRALWQEARANTPLSATREETAYAVLYLLTAENALSEQERKDELLRLEPALVAGELCLPTARARFELSSTGLVELVEDPRRLALREAVSNLVPKEEGRAWTRADTAHHEREALLAQIGDLPTVPQAKGWRVQAAPVSFYAARGVSVDEIELFFFSREALSAALSHSLALPAGFSLDCGEESDVHGVVVRGDGTLAEGGPVLRVRHADPARLGRVEARRIALLRAGLVTLALLGALATVLSVRALARERRLAGLKQAFIANVSHDLRTPLASILLMAENLEAGRIDASRAKSHYYGAIRREASRLRRLVDDVLDFSRLERGETARLALESVELERFGRELEEECAERVRESGKEFVCRREMFVGAAEVDAFALRRALHNLLDNALQHADSPRVELNLTCENEQLRLAVSDAGRGIPPAERERIFEPYQRGSTSSSARGGTGLGLAIVREIARAHGGEVQLCATQGGPGARFEIRLPLRPQLGHNGASA